MKNKYGIRENLYDEILKIFKELNITSVYLFGSRARGDYTETSDIDIAVKFDFDHDDNYIKLYTKLEELNTLYKFDVVDLAMLRNDEFKNRIEKEWVIIYKK